MSRGVCQGDGEFDTCVKGTGNSTHFTKCVEFPVPLTHATSSATNSLVMVPATRTSSSVSVKIPGYSYAMVYSFGLSFAAMRTSASSAAVFDGAVAG